MTPWSPLQQLPPHHFYWITPIEYSYCRLLPDDRLVTATLPAKKLRPVVDPDFDAGHSLGQTRYREDGDFSSAHFVGTRPLRGCARNDYDLARNETM
jgi:hypothetical protein